MKKNLNIKGILFDLDGTLAHSLPCLLDIINQLLRENNFPIISEKQLRGYVDCGTCVMIKKSLPQPTPPIDLTKTQQQLLDRYINNLASQTTFYPYLANYCQSLSKLGVPWGIVTNRPKMMTTPLIDAHPFLQQANCVVCSDTLNIAKPNPEPILHACQQIHLNANDVIYVGDTDNDVLAAQRAGLFSTFVSYGYRREEHHGKSIKADIVVNTPLELIAFLNTQFTTQVMS